MASVYAIDTASRRWPLSLHPSVRLLSSMAGRVSLVVPVVVVGDDAVAVAERLRSWGYQRVEVEERMTPEEFLEHIDAVRYHSDKGKSRVNRARNNYVDYIKAYRETSLAQLCSLMRITSYPGAVKQAARDRDTGCPMVVVELLS